MKNIIIICRGKGWEDAPGEGETWGIYNICLKRSVSMVWDMHRINEPPLCYDANQQIIINHVNNHDIPYMTLKKHDNIPSSIEFPIEEMPIQYVECSLGYMIWYAVYIGATNINIYGAPMQHHSEFAHQLKSTDYWIGYARGKGLEVTIHGVTNLCTGSRGRYGYDFQ